MLCLPHLRFDYNLPNQRQILQSCQTASEQSIYSCQVWQVWDRSTRALPEQEARKLCLSKAGAGSCNWFVLGQSTWWICPRATDSGHGWLCCLQFRDELSGNWKVSKILQLKSLHSEAHGLMKASTLRVWEPQCSEALRRSGEALWNEIQSLRAFMGFFVLPFKLICMMGHLEDTLLKSCSTMLLVSSSSDFN